MSLVSHSPLPLLSRLRQRIFNTIHFSLPLLFLTLVVVGVSTWIAMTTRFHAHPDERHHVYTFSYFVENAWPPDLNSDDLTYDPFGNSRVYNGDIAYLLFGKIARLISPVFNLQPSFFNQQDGFHKYRLLNVVALSLLFTGLFFFREKAPDETTHLRSNLTRIFGFTLCLIPQVYYIYGYANSDAWGLTMAILLFVHTVRIISTPFSKWRPTQPVLLGILTGLILTAKSNYLIALLLPYALLTVYFVKILKTEVNCRPGVGKSLVVVGILAAAIAFPLKIYYPLTQPNYFESRLAMQEERSIEGLKPSDPSKPGFMLSSKGYTIQEVLTLNPLPDSRWIYVTFESFYGVLGFMNVRAPDWVTRLGWTMFLLAIGTTYAIELRKWRRNNSMLKYIFIFAPLVILVNLMLSLYYSWTFSYQAQGRFLFPIIPAMAVLVFGISRSEPGVRILERIRFAITGLLFLNVLVFFLYTLRNPYLYALP